MSTQFAAVVEPWRAEIYVRVVKERFNENRSEFVRMALDEFCEKLGFAVRPPRKDTEGA